jgi:GntR family transcriptional repressor for pyruvate dehydrogenase complex
MKQLNQVIEYVQLNIEQGEWPVDSKLPSERDLVNQLNVSRATIREGLMNLKQRGLIYSRPGAGHFVCSQESVSNAEFIVTHDLEISHEELREYRFAIESHCAFLAAERATDIQLANIERAHRHLKHAHAQQDIKAEGLADARFHLAIAEASGNRILALSLKSLFSLLRANVTQNIGTMSRRPETKLRLMKQHTALFESIFYKKPVKARQIAQEHMEFVDRILEDTH